MAGLGDISWRDVMSWRGGIAWLDGIPWRDRMGVLQITRPNSTDVSSYGIYDTSTIEKDVSVVVTTTFGLRG